MIVDLNAMFEALVPLIFIYVMVYAFHRILEKMKHEAYQKGFDKASIQVTPTHNNPGPKGKNSAEGGK